jgi:glutathione synthase/RimK-type ligase-like ATP-grasp enzyme
MQTSVLIITERDDVHGHALIWALSRAGIRCDRWSISEFPDGQRTSVRIFNSSLPPSFQIAGLSQPYQSIWIRRLAPPECISRSLADADVQMAIVQARRSAEGLRSIFSRESVWINPLDRRQTVNHKPQQLVTARKVGFPIPETLISNDPDDIRRFHSEHWGNVVCKFFTPAFWQSQAGGTVSASFTSELTTDLLDNDIAFSSCPAIYQEKLPKKSDVRVTFFGSTYQAVRIWSQQSSLGSVDYRSDMRFESAMEPMKMDSHFLDRCMELSSQMGLLHGSYDFVERPDGSMVFLEINEMGQFLWLEERLPQLPMLSMFAAFSLEPRSEFRFDPARWPAHSFHTFVESEAYAEFRQELMAKAAIASFQYLE